MSGTRPSFATGHPLWAANLPLARLELDAWAPHSAAGDTLIVLYGAREGADLALRGAERLAALGYTRGVHRLEGGLEGWRQAGGGRDVPRRQRAEGKASANWWSHGGIRRRWPRKK